MNNDIRDLRQNLGNAIIEELSKIDPNTGDIPELNVLWGIIEKIYNEDMKMIMKVMEKKKMDEMMMKVMEKKKMDEKINKYPEEMRKKSMVNYADYHALDVENVSIHDVFCTSAGIKGWATEYGS